MALKPKVNPGERGFSLLELLTAMVVASIVALLAYSVLRMYWTQSIRHKKEAEQVFRAQVYLQSLANNIRQGQGISLIAPDEITLINSAGNTLRYAIVDSIPTVNENPQDFTVTRWSVDVWGPEKQPEAWEDQSHWSLDSLDRDRNGVLDFFELDRDFNGVLEAEECRLVARIRIQLAFTGEGGRERAWEVTVHPRNRK